MLLYRRPAAVLLVFAMAALPGPLARGAVAQSAWGAAPSAAALDANVAPAGFPEDPATSRERGPWYTDLGRHWARNYIKVLWEEGVAPPPLNAHLGPGESEWTVPGPFGPDKPADQPVYADMIVRSFPGGRFPPPRFALAAPKPGGRPEVSTAGLPGQAQSRPAEPLRRHEAVVTLIEALGLAEFADNLDPADVEIFLSRFRDRTRVPPESRKALALAVHLGIIEGYPDRTVKPMRTMSRAEGATVVYRSCLLLTDADPNPFSPDGDGVEDVTTFYLGSLRNRNARSWNLDVLDASGTVLRHFGSAVGSREMTPSIEWDGRNDDGLLLAPGVYYYQGRLKDRNGIVHYSALKPIVIEGKALLGFAHPTLVLPGEAVRLWAAASGGPASVTVGLSSFPEAGSVALARLEDDDRTWETFFAIPETADPGDCLASFVARWEEEERTAEATFVVGDLLVRARLEPNPTTAGGEVAVLACTNLPADACAAVALLPSGCGGPITVDLAAADGAGPGAGERMAWVGSFVVPAETPPGTYTVRVTAWHGVHSATAILDLEVVTEGDGLRFYLSD